jgi:hypothetical protein
MSPEFSVESTLFIESKTSAHDSRMSYEGRTERSNIASVL